MSNAARININPKFFYLCLIALSLAVVIYFSYAAAYDRGPFICDNGCLVRAPTIDPRTSEFLDSQLAPIDRAPMAMWASGSTYIICNATHCTNYKMTFSGDIIGENFRAVEDSSNGAGGGAAGGRGGGVGGGGGMPIGGGTPPKPKVIVKPPQQLPA